MKNAHLRWAHEQELRWQRRPDEPNEENLAAYLPVVEAATRIWHAGGRGITPLEEQGWPEPLRQQVPATLLEAVIAVLKDQLPREHTDLALWLGGRALGTALAESPPNGEHIIAALARQHAHHPFMQAFSDAFTGSLINEPAQKAGWSKALANLRFEARRPTDPVTEKALQEVTLRWQRRRSPFEPWFVWKFSSQHLSLSFQSYDQLRWLNLLMRLDPSAWLLALERLSFPQLIEAAIFTDILIEDEDLIISSIRATSGTYAETGTGVALVYLLDAVKQHLERVHEALSNQARAGAHLPHTATPQQEAHERLCRFKTEEGPAWLRTCFTALLESKDGTVVAIRLSEHLLREELRPPAHYRRQDWSARTAMLHALWETLARHSVRAEMVQQIWQEIETAGEPADDTWPMRGVTTEDRIGEGCLTLQTAGLPFLLTALAIEGTKSGSALVLPPDTRKLIWAWFLDLLVAGDVGLRLLDLSHHRLPGDMQEWTLNQLAATLVAHADPVLALQDAYSKLEPQRRRSLYKESYARETKPSEILLRLSQYAAAILSQKMANPSAADALFMMAFRLLHQLYLRVPPTRTRSRYEHLRQLMADSFAFLPAVFGPDLRAVLAQLLPPLSDDPWVLTQAAARLQWNGLPVDNVTLLFSSLGIDLQAAANEVQQWEPQP